MNIITRPYDLCRCYGDFISVCQQFTMVCVCHQSNSLWADAAWSCCDMFFCHDDEVLKMEDFCVLYHTGFSLLQEGAECVQEPCETFLSCVMKTNRHCKLKLQCLSSIFSNIMWTQSWTITTQLTHSKYRITQSVCVCVCVCVRDLVIVWCVLCKSVNLSKSVFV